MKRMILLAGMALSVSACTLPSFSMGTPTTTQPVSALPAPLAPVKIDETALRAAWGAFDVALDALNLYMDAKPKFIGTPAANRIADAVDVVNAALTAAQIAADTLNSGAYLENMGKAKIALSDLKAAIAAAKGK